MPTVSVYDEILAWSKGRPDWLRDALRRIVTSSDLTDADLAELAELCKARHGLSATTAIPVVLSSSDLPSPSGAGSVTLASITHLSNVNALAPNETLSFAPTGITIIYGDNGAGKSSFSRIMRRAFRARGADEAILSNALSENPAGAPTARIDFSIANTTTSHLWEDGVEALPQLSNISVFDSASAQVYVEDKTEVRFRPFGLDVIDRAASICLRVKKVLDGEAEALRARSTGLPTLTPTTEAGRLVASLTALTSRSEVNRLGTLTDEEVNEHASLLALLSAAQTEDPKAKAADLRLKAGRLRQLGDELRLMSEALGEARFKELSTLVFAAASASVDAQRVAEELAKELALEGIGSPEWTAMWQSAKTYSEKRAYPNHEFPHTADGTICVLCQQALQPATQTRMRRFAEFVLGEVRETARVKQDALQKARRTIAEAQPSERGKVAMADLEALSPNVAATVGAFLTAALRCREAVISASATPAPCTKTPPLAELDTIARSLDEQADGLTQAADPVARAKSEARLSELDARRVLGFSLDVVYAEIERLVRLNAYERCAKDTDTRALTKLGGELTKKYVTDALTAQFESELKRLGFTSLELELKPAGGQRGQLLHKLQLKQATKASLPKVVSEGESRCIALAAFMAEVERSGSNSAIVFDDPVSSLDHRWRTSVARRLVEAAQNRQVIVFTHELAFLSELLQHADAHKIEADTQTLKRDRIHTGRVEAGLPWNGLTTRKRIGVLHKNWHAAEKTFRTVGRSAYEPLATQLYAGLRTTWERAVEQVLLNEVVLRFRPGIETNRLKVVDDINQDDIDAVKQGMTKSSKWMGGHDQALALNEPLPEPREIWQDIEALENWVAAVEKRRR